MKGNNKWQSCSQKVPQNCGAMHLSQVGSGACTGILTVRAQHFHLSLRGRCTDLPIHIGAIFADLQAVPNLGTWHGSERKLSHPCSVYHNSPFFTMTIISAHSFRNIQQIDGHLCGSRALAEPPDCIRKLCQKSKLVACAPLAPVRTGGFGECIYFHPC
jgi:hypothetical protein